MEKVKKKIYHNGWLIEFTGESEILHGKTAYHAIYLEGPDGTKGRKIVTYRNPKTGILPPL